MAITVNTTEAKDLAGDILAARLVPMIHSSPGLGKSSIMRELAKDFNLKLIDFRLSQCDVTDLLGFPDKNEATDRARYMPMETFPLEGDEVPGGYDGWLLFFDELTSADRSVQKGAYKILLDRMVGDRHLHDKVAMAAAGNMMTDNAIVDEMGTALQSRLVHMELRVDHESWLAWARAFGIHQMITSFIAFKPTALFDFKPDHSDKTFACPRTWEFADRLLKLMSLGSSNLLAGFAGTVSEGIAREFIAFTQLYGQLPSFGEIMGNPAGTTMPQEPGVLYALTGSIGAYAKDTNLDKLIVYIKRMPRDFQAVCLREIVRRNQGIMKHQAITDWLITSGVELF